MHQCVTKKIRSGTCHKFTKCTEILQRKILSAFYKTALRTVFTHTKTFTYRVQGVRIQTLQLAY